MYMYICICVCVCVYIYIYIYIYVHIYEDCILNQIVTLSFLCCVTDIKIAWINPWHLLESANIFSLYRPVFLQYNIAFLAQASQIFLFSLCKNTLDVRSGRSSLNFFHPILTWVIELASAPPLILNMSPRQQK